MNNCNECGQKGPLWMSVDEARKTFSYLWNSAVCHPGYVKDDWERLERHLVSLWNSKKQYEEIYMDLEDFLRDHEPSG